MEKKFFEVPYLKVVNVKNDILTSSVQGGFGEGSTDKALAPGRRGMFDDDYEDDYDY